MISKVELDAQALVRIMGNAFDGDLYERGRKDTRKTIQQDPSSMNRMAVRKKIKEVLENDDFRSNAAPSYWIGCLAEIDYV